MAATLARSAIILALMACRSTPPAPSASPALGANPAATIVREPSYLDSDLAARNLGRLDVAVRSADRPTQSLPDALVTIRLSARDTLRRTLSDQRGLAQFDTVPVGQYELVVRRIGYGSARATVPVKGGCRTDVEVYVSLQSLGINPPPPMPGRVAITTCEREE